MSARRAAPNGGYRRGPDYRGPESHGPNTSATSRLNGRYSGAGWGTGDATPSRARWRGERNDFHRAPKSGAATKLAITSKMPVMRLER